MGGGSVDEPGASSLEVDSEVGSEAGDASGQGVLLELELDVSGAATGAGGSVGARAALCASGACGGAMAGGSWRGAVVEMQQLSVVPQRDLAVSCVHDGIDLMCPRHAQNHVNGVV